MSDSLVIDLQQLAQSSATDLLELLRRAKTLAVKLDLQDARRWIDHELDGYPPSVELPRYRIIPSELRTRNPFHGWNAVAWGAGGNLQEHFASSEIRFPLSEVEVATQGDGQPHASLNQSEMDVLLSIEADFGRLPCARFFSRASFVGILEGVRAKILDWSLALEKQGVLGRGMTFNEIEKRGAAAVQLRVSDVTTRILFLSANADRASPLDVEKEQNRIVKVRNGSKHQAKIRIESLPDLDLPELTKSLRLHTPAVVHFSGHHDLPRPRQRTRAGCCDDRRTCSGTRERALEFQRTSPRRLRGSWRNRWM